MSRASSLALALLVFASCECIQPKPDASLDDAGLDAGLDGGRVWEDGGEIDVAGGCTRVPEGSKFIVVFDTKDRVLCAAVSFRRFDGGFAPMFGGGPWPLEYKFYPGEWAAEPYSDYEIDEARVGLCTTPEEQADGRLNEAGVPIEDFKATKLTIGWQVVPQTVEAEGTIAFFGRQHRFSTSQSTAGMNERCRGP